MVRVDKKVEHLRVGKNMKEEVYGKLIFFFKQKTAYEIVSRDWSSDVCSSDLP